MSFCKSVGPNRYLPKLSDLGEGRTATFADGRVLLILADVGRIIPATLALVAWGLTNFYVNGSAAVPSIFRCKNYA